MGSGAARALMWGLLGAFVPALVTFARKDFFGVRDLYGFSF
jgi:hypothetical protein